MLQQKLVQNPEGPEKLTPETIVKLKLARPDVIIWRTRDRSDYPNQVKLIHSTFAIVHTIYFPPRCIGMVEVRGLLTHYEGRNRSM